MTGINVASVSQTPRVIFSSDREPIENKARRFAENAGNTIIAGAKMTAVVGVGAGATYVAKKPAVAKFLSSSGKIIKEGVSSLIKLLPDKVKNGQFVKTILEKGGKALQFAKSSPLGVKIAVGLGLLSTLSTYLYKKGRIQEKYDHRAKILDNLSF